MASPDSSSSWIVLHISTSGGRRNSPGLSQPGVASWENQPFTVCSSVGRRAAFKPMDRKKAYASWTVIRNFPMTERQPCIIPFCRRTTKALPNSEWICARHWAAVPRALRRVMHRARRRIRAGKQRFRNMQIYEMAWKRCKRAALRNALP